MMNKTVEQQIAGLSHLTAPQLREKYLALFDEATRSGNRDFLIKRIAWRMQSLEEGGLSERARKRAAELARDADIRMTIPRVQQATGTIRTGDVTFEDLPAPLVIGSILTRKYRGKLIQVSVLPIGFDYQGEHYRSLSAIAKVVTGSHWNGPLFFGLRDKQQA